MRNWKKIIVDQELSIRDVMKVIDALGSQTAIVCSKKDQLIGIATDGDIRRGLLQNANMDDQIITVMNSEPIYILKNKIETDPRDSIKKFFINSKVKVMPVLDDNNRVIDVISESFFNDYTERDNPVFIMAGGFGTRLKPLTDNCPKPMLPLGDKPMLEHILLQLSNQGFSNFYFSVHYLPEVIKNYFGDGSQWGVKIRYVQEETPLGTGGALSLLPSNINKKPLIMINGDILTDLDFTDLLKSHLNMEADISVCLREIETSISYGVVDVVDNYVSAIREKPTYRHKINTGIYVINQDAIKTLKENEYIDMPTFIEKRLSSNYKVNASIHHGYWLDIGQMRDYKKAIEDISHINKWLK